MIKIHAKCEKMSLRVGNTSLGYWVQEETWHGMRLLRRENDKEYLVLASSTVSDLFPSINPVDDKSIPGDCFSLYISDGSTAILEHIKSLLDTGVALTVAQ